MANQTVYPYGTGGSLPSNIGIINDLYTGGADKALSAEQGKILGEAVVELVKDVDDSEDATFYLSDQSGNVLLRIKNGHVETANFNSETATKLNFNIV